MGKLVKCIFVYQKAPFIIIEIAEMSKDETNPSAAQTEHLNLKVKSQVEHSLLRMENKFFSRSSQQLNWKSWWMPIVKGKDWQQTMWDSFLMVNVSMKPKLLNSWICRMVTKSMCLLNKLEDTLVDTFYLLFIIQFTKSFISHFHAKIFYLTELWKLFLKTFVCWNLLETI